MKAWQVKGAIAGLLLVASGAYAIAQIPGQGGSPAGITNIQPSDAFPVTYSSGGGGSATFPGPNFNGHFRFTTSATTSTNVSFNWAGGGYPGNASPYVPACVVTLESTAQGTAICQPTKTGLTITWTTTGTVVTGDVIAQ